jgi:hypothetical protein
MASNLSTHAPIVVYQTRTNTTEQTQDYLEAAGQTFLFGTPVQLNSGTGYCQAWDGATLTNGILGFSESPGMNLGTAGAGAPPQFGSVGFPGSPTTYGTVPYQPAAVNIPAGATFSTGRTTVAQAVPETIFIGQVDNNTGGAYTPSIASIGNQYGLTVDANGYWYVDFGKSTAGTNTVLKIVGLYPNDLASGSATTEIAGGRVLFTINIAASQVQV